MKGIFTIAVLGYSKFVAIQYPYTYVGSEKLVLLGDSLSLLHDKPKCVFL